MVELAATVIVGLVGLWLVASVVLFIVSFFDQLR